MKKKGLFLLICFTLFECSNLIKEQNLATSGSNSQVTNTNEIKNRSIKIDSLLNNYFNTGSAGATALISQEGRILYKKAFGKANIELEIDMDVDHKFRIASNTKQFTACAILKLEEQGQLSLSDDITKYIKNYPTKGHKITIEHLLTHTSGIQDFSSHEGFNQIEDNDYTTLEFINIFKKYPMVSIPGEEYNYSNSGYFILGYIIEKITKKSYGDYLEDTFFKPIGMKNTFFDFQKKSIEKRALGYTQQPDNKCIPSKKISMSIPFSAGGLISTVEDLNLWYKSLKSNTILHKSSLKKAHSPFKLNNGNFTRYGYGWDIGTVIGFSTIAHGGAISGYYSTLVYLPKEAILSVVLTNCNWIDASFFHLSSKMASIIIDRTYFEKNTISKNNLIAYEAVYKTATNEKLTITIEGSKPFLTIGNGRKRLINYYKDDTFYSESNFTTLKFIKDHFGNIKSVISTRAKSITFNRTSEKLPKKSIYHEIKITVYKNTSKGIEYYKNLKVKSYDEYNFLNQEDLNRLGYDLLSQNRYEDAIKIFKLLVSEYPKEFNPYDSLGEAYFKNGQLDLAKKNYKKSIELNPNNNNAREIIKKIDSSK